MTWLRIALLAVFLAGGCGGGGSSPPQTVDFTVTAVLPRSASEDVPLMQDVVVTFSKPVDETTLTPDSFRIVAESGDAIAGTRTLSPVAATQVRFSPVLGYFPFATHTIEVSRDLRDEGGELLDRDYAFTFRTEQTGPVLPKQTQLENKGNLLNVGRFLHRMTLLPNQRFLVAGGYATDGQPALSTAENLVISLGQSSIIPQLLLEPRAAHIQVKLKDGRVLLAGGERSSFPFVPLASAEIFDPDPGVFSFLPAAPMNFPRSFAHASVLDDGRVLVTGGQGLAPDGQTFIFRADAEIYDPQTDTWELVGSRMEAGRSAHFSAATGGGDVVVIGGTPGTPSATLWRLSTETFSLQLGTPLFDHFFGAGTILPDGRPLVASGVASAGVTIWDSRYGFIGAVNDLPTERSFATATPFPDGRVLIIGGLDVGTSPVNIHDTLDVFFPIGATGRIFRATDVRLPAPTTHHDAALGSDGKVWVTGGLSTTGTGMRQVFAIRPEE